MRSLKPGAGALRLTTIAATAGYLAWLPPAAALMPPSAHPSLAVQVAGVDGGLGLPGVDIGRAGQSRESRMNYVFGFIQETRENILARCSELLKSQDGPADAMAFCRDLMPAR
jgi:hypothetical protein